MLHPYPESPSECGSKDAYEGKPPVPHKYLYGVSEGYVKLTDPIEIAAYMEAYDNEDDREKQ